MLLELELFGKKREGGGEVHIGSYGHKVKSFALELGQRNTLLLILFSAFGFQALSFALRFLNK